MQDTSTITANAYCASVLGSNFAASSLSSDGGIPLTCDGLTTPTYIEDRGASFSNLLNDGDGTQTSPGFPSLPEGVTVAYTKFICKPQS